MFYLFVAIQARRSVGCINEVELTSRHMAEASGPTVYDAQAEGVHALMDRFGIDRAAMERMPR